MNDLFDSYVMNLRRRDRDITKAVERLDKHLRPQLGHLDPRVFGTREMDRYIDRRKQEKTKTGTFTRNATINREMAIVSASMRLAATQLNRSVRFEKLPEEDGVRQGIVSEEVYRLMLVELPDHVKPFWVLAYYTGVRKGQLLKLRWEWVDWDQWTIPVPGWFNGERIPKYGKLHPIPLYCAEMREYLTRAWHARDPT